MNALTKKLMEMDEDALFRLYMRVFNTDDGQLVLEDLKQRCFEYLPLPLGEEGQRAEGKRNVIKHIQTQLTQTEK